MVVVIMVGDRTINNVGSIHTVAESEGYPSVWFSGLCLVLKSTDKEGDNMINWLVDCREDLEEGMRTNQKRGMNQMKKFLHLRNRRLEMIKESHQERSSMMIMINCPMCLCKSKSQKKGGQ